MTPDNQSSSLFLRSSWKAIPVMFFRQKFGDGVWRTGTDIVSELTTEVPESVALRAAKAKYPDKYDSFSRDERIRRGVLTLFNRCVTSLRRSVYPIETRRLPDTRDNQYRLAILSDELLKKQRLRRRQHSHAPLPRQVVNRVGIRCSEILDLIAAQPAGVTITALIDALRPRVNIDAVIAQYSRACRRPSTLPRVELEAAAIATYVTRAVRHLTVVRGLTISCVTTKVYRFDPEAPVRLPTQRKSRRRGV